MIVDCVTFNGENELWDLRYNILKDVVDEFVVVEFDQTFSGKPKPFTLLPLDYPKATYFPITEENWDTPEYNALADKSPNVPKNGPDHWRREFCQKESIKKALAHLRDKDVVIIGDVDEVLDPLAVEVAQDLLKDTPDGVLKNKLCVYTYWLNNRSSEEFWGPIVANWGYIKDGCLNDIRSDVRYRTLGTKGWHFTSVGGPEALKRKLTDSYTADSYAPPQVLDNLKANMENGRDFLGRDFKYWIDETDWPQYLRDNREKYRHLLK